MKTFPIILLITICSINAFAQMDISDSKADRKTFAFDNMDYTVQQFLIDEIEENTKCCGESSMIIKVEIDNTGSVIGVKPTNGDNFCYQKSIMESVRKIKWDASGIEKSEVINFEIKLDIACTGTINHNP